MRVAVIIETDCSTKRHAYEIVQKFLERALVTAIGMHIVGTPEIIGTEDTLRDAFASEVIGDVMFAAAHKRRML